MSGTWDAWVGRTRRTEERISLATARALAATLDDDPSAFRAGDRLPPGWHWTYFNEPAPRSRLAEDGHEARGEFLPPVPLPRRMWAGGRLRFHRPFEIERTARRTSSVERVTEKEGRSGPLVFVTVRHRYGDVDGPLLDEEQDLVYRERPVGAPGAAGDPSDRLPEGAEVVETFEADPVTLFRFSALTFNGHRIHYDHPYATEEEGYPGLVVHGPLIALLLLRAGARETSPRAFEYRALAPVFAGERFELVARRGGGDGIELWARHPERGVAMAARIR